MAKTDIAARVKELLNEFLEQRELELYRVIYKKEGSGWVLRVFLDKPADADTEYVSIDECEEATRFLSDKLDELDLIDRAYNLEVSSPGLDRELIHESDYTRFAGREVEVRTYGQINGSKYFEGTLVGKTDGIVSVDTASGRLDIPEDKISKINLAVVF
ncbi:MAG: ribosome maturation factor RimP [Mogibacterium sp.]|nr:ribosome maturation factor RimP [Mogibacterium sp.]